MHEQEQTDHAATDWPAHHQSVGALDASQIAAGETHVGRGNAPAALDIAAVPLDRAAFFKRAAQRRIRVDLPELGHGMHVYVRGLTASEAQGGLEKQAIALGLDPNDSTLTVAMCTVGADGAAMFTVPDDLDALRALDVAVFSAIYKAIVKQSGVTQADVEAAAKN